VGAGGSAARKVAAASISAATEMRTRFDAKRIG
jgi:hypothetical protein